jgi:hypothetical protein
MLCGEAFHASGMGKSDRGHRIMSDEADNTAARRPGLSEAARRALAEAAARRAEIDARGAFAPKELGGRGGLEPGRYGDWEIRGLTSDF